MTTTSNACTCKTCPSTGCNCGCQTAKAAQPAGCQCGNACNCGPTCGCKRS